MTRRTRLRIEPLDNRCLPSFTPLASYDVGSTAVIAADVNNDDVADLALGSGEVLLGHGDGTFDSPTQSGGAGSMAVGDLDGDGNLDLVFTGTSDVTVLLGNGDGTFAAPSNINVTDPSGGESLSSVAVGDFDGDGLLDLGVVSITSVFGGYDSYGYPINNNASSLHVLVGTGDGTFSGPSTTSLGGGYYTAPAAADFNGDGIDDLATAAPDNTWISVVLGDSSGVFQGPTHYSTYWPGAVAVADVDGDLDTDLVVASHYGGVGVLLGDGAGGFADAQYYWVVNYAVGPDPVSVAVADFNGDGALDIAITSNSYPNYTGQIDVFLGYGDGTFAYPINQSLGAGSYAYALAADDFDGDGLPDVAVTLEAGFQLNVLTNAGDWVTLAIGDVTVTEGDGGTLEAVFTVTRG